MHPRDHLVELLEEFGPFRASWCMPWEGTLPVFKALFRMGNWNSAPYSVCSLWASKSVSHYRDPARCNWYADSVEPSTEFQTQIDALAQNAPVLRRLLSLGGQRPYAVRFLRLVKRGAEEVRNGCWLLVEQRGQAPLVGRVDQMMEASYTRSSVSLIRMWCSFAQAVTIDPDGTLWSTINASRDVGMLVQLESAQLSVVTRTETSQRIVYHC